MKIGVITLPLHTNYGGILQAYALKTVLEDMGHEVEVIDRAEKMVLPPSWKMPLIYAKRLFLNIVMKGKGPEIFRERRISKEFPVVASEVLKFTTPAVAPRVVKSYAEIQAGEYEAIVVGSDQVWRPAYFGKIEDAFLKFAEKWNLRRVAYAASFGTDMLEYSYEQLDVCSRLLKKFDAVSVRESSAVDLCDDWFDRDDAVHVLDPVMLLSSDYYAGIAVSSYTRPAKGKCLVYILDETEDKMAVASRIGNWFSGNIYNASVNPRDGRRPLSERVVQSMQQWLSCFRDAEFVVTDSFHGCVMSILFHKPFIVLGNVSRGLARINSLLETFGLEDRLVQGLDPEDDGEYYLSGIDWDAVDEKLEHYRGISMDFLKSALK